jgi:hypothetical protein
MSMLMTNPDGVIITKKNAGSEVIGKGLYVQHETIH